MAKNEKTDKKVKEVKGALDKKKKLLKKVKLKIKNGGNATGGSLVKKKRGQKWKKESIDGQTNGNFGWPS